LLKNEAKENTFSHDYVFSLALLGIMDVKTKGYNKDLGYFSALPSLKRLNILCSSKNYHQQL